MFRRIRFVESKPTKSRLIPVSITRYNVVKTAKTKLIAVILMNKCNSIHYAGLHCPQNREEQSGGEGEARASTTAGAAAARSAARSARIRWFRVGDSPCTCHCSGSPSSNRSQRLQHQWHPGNPDAPSGPQWQQHQEKTHRRRWVIEFFDVDDPSTRDYSYDTTAIILAIQVIRKPIPLRLCSWVFQHSGNN